MKKQDVGTLSAKILEDLKEQLSIRQEERDSLLDEISRLEEQVKFFSGFPDSPPEVKKRKRREKSNVGKRSDRGKRKPGKSIKGQG